MISKSRPSASMNNLNPQRNPRHVAGPRDGAPHRSSRLSMLTLCQTRQQSTTTHSTRYPLLSPRSLVFSARFTSSALQTSGTLASQHVLEWPAVTSPSYMWIQAGPQRWLCRGSSTPSSRQGSSVCPPVGPNRCIAVDLTGSRTPYWSQHASSMRALDNNKSTSCLKSPVLR